MLLIWRKDEQARPTCAKDVSMTEGYAEGYAHTTPTTAVWNDNLRENRDSNNPIGSFNRNVPVAVITDEERGENQNIRREFPSDDEGGDINTYAVVGWERDDPNTF